MLWYQLLGILLWETQYHLFARQQVPCSQTHCFYLPLWQQPTVTYCCYKQKPRECATENARAQLLLLLLLPPLEPEWDLGGLTCWPFTCCFQRQKIMLILPPLCTVFCQGLSLEDYTVKPIRNESR